MKNAGRVSVDLAPIVARAMAFLNPDAVERFYALSPAKYYADTMRGAGKSSVAITAGRAEQQIVSAHALGILRAAEEATIRGLLRAVAAKHTIKRMMPLSHPRRARKFRLIPA